MLLDISKGLLDKYKMQDGEIYFSTKIIMTRKWRELSLGISYIMIMSRCPP